MRINVLSAASRWQMLSLVLLSNFVLPACVNLQAVREFAKTSAATADYQQVVKDYLESPTRQQLYQTDAEATELATIAQAQQAQKAALLGTQHVLVAYLSALGDLAADELPSADTEISGLSTALRQAKFVGASDAASGKQTAAAASSIAEVLIKGAFTRWQQRKVKQIVRDTDDNVQTVVAGLRLVVTDDFDAVLAQEETLIRNRFKTINMAATRTNGTETIVPLARILETEHLAQVKVRRDRLKAYGEVLTRIGKGHADLRQNIDNLKGQELRARLQGYAQDLRTLYKAFTELQS